MLLDGLIPDAAANVTIVATDINPRFLAKASQGVYGEWSFRQTPPEIRQRTHKMLDDFGAGSHIANLGHGILPDVPVSHAQAFVTAVQEWRPK